MAFVADAAARRLEIRAGPFKLLLEFELPVPIAVAAPAVQMFRVPLLPRLALPVIVGLDAEDSFGLSLPAAAANIMSAKAFFTRNLGACCGLLAKAAAARAAPPSSSSECTLPLCCIGDDCDGCSSSVCRTPLRRIDLRVMDAVVVTVIWLFSSSDKSAALATVTGESNRDASVECTDADAALATLRGGRPRPRDGGESADGICCSSALVTERRPRLGGSARASVVDGIGLLAAD